MALDTQSLFPSSSELSSGTGALLVSVHLAEYNCLRSEILLLINLEHACIGFALGGIGAILSLKNDLVQDYGFAIVLALSCLGIIYCDLDSRILRCAHYIHSYLRPALIGVTGRPEILQWEEYTRDKLQYLKRRPTLLGGLGTTFQGLIFLLPAIGFWLVGMSHRAGLNSKQLTGYAFGAAFVLYLTFGVLGVNLRKLTSAEEMSAE